MTRDWAKPPLTLKSLAGDLYRFVSSNHSRDLLTIAAAAPITVGIFAWIVWYKNYQVSTEIFAAIIAAAFAAMAWAYQSANSRFGAADIFASEIVTICRISAVVDFIPHLVDGLRPHGRAVPPGRSAQDYVVIFHNNSKDLEILDGVVVTWVTEFYVYFNAMIDAMSHLPNQASGSAPPSPEETKQYREALLNVLYVAYLMFESGDQALKRLIDDKHQRQESVLIALMNEVPAYIALHQAFEHKKSDIGWQRIHGRLRAYQDLMIEIEHTTAEPSGDKASTQRTSDLAAQVTTRWKEGGL